jgi:hypothetical protein
MQKINAPQNYLLPNADKDGYSYDDYSTSEL